MAARCRRLRPPLLTGPAPCDFREQTFASGSALRLYWLHIAAALGAAAILLAISCTAFTLIVAARQAWAGGRLRSQRS